jgi:flagellin-like protein
MRKGVSPLIAVIMLIAFTMIVAGILATWATQFVTQSRSEFQFCTKSRLLIQRAHYDDQTNNLTLSMFNTGDVPLKGFSVILEYENGSATSEKFENLEIDYQTIKTLVMSSVNETLNSLAVQSLQCKGAYDSLDKYGIQGLGFKSF